MSFADFWSNFVGSLMGWAVTSGVRLVIAVVIWIVSFKLVDMTALMIRRSGDKGKMDKTIARTLGYIFKIGVKCFIVICLVGYVGIDTGGLAALVVSLGACIGLALNGTVSNLAGGIIIIVTRPFKVDDFIEAQGYSGTVEDIRIITTRIVTPDNKVVYVPNGQLSSDTIVNYSVKKTRRIDLKILISYDEDYKKAETMITELCTAHDRVLRSPVPTVRICSYAEYGIELAVRLWVDSSDYWPAYYDILELLKSEFDKAGIKIPYKQVDVNIKRDTSSDEESL